MLNWYLRYRPFMDLLDDAGAHRVLDVGSGWYGLSWYWPHQVVQTDLSFLGVPPATGRTGSATFVRSSAERLPFGDGAFDFAISSDMLEHLPDAIRAASVAELARVARYGAIVGFPSGRHAATMDRRLARVLHLLHRSQPEWLSEHLAAPHYPDVATVAAGLPPGWSIRRRIPHGGAGLASLLVLTEMVVPGGAALTSRLERRAHAGGWRLPAPRRRWTREILVLVAPLSDPVGPAG